MTLYLDPPTIVFSPNMLALNRITSSQGDWTGELGDIGGYPLFKLEYSPGPSPSFAAARIRDIASDLLPPIVLSAVNSTYTFPGPDGVAITSVQAGVLVDNAGVQILVWDKSDCNGSGYHVFNYIGFPIRHESALAVFHEISHAHHTNLGTSPATLDLQEALAINETNLLCSELGLPHRNPFDHDGGCGPGRKKSRPWDLLADTVLETVGVFFGADRPRRMPRQEIVNASLRRSLELAEPFVDSATSAYPMHQASTWQVLITILSVFYDSALRFERTGPRAEVQIAVSRSISNLPEPADDIWYAMLAPGLTAETTGWAEICLRNPYMIMRNARERSGDAQWDYFRSQIDDWLTTVRSMADRDMTPIDGLLSEHVEERGFRYCKRGER